MPHARNHLIRIETAPALQELSGPRCGTNTAAVHGLLRRNWCLQPPRHAGAFVTYAARIQAFGVADPDTAEYFSRLTGEGTTLVESESESRAVSGGGTLLFSHVQRGRAVTTAEQRRRLLTPDEVRRLPREEQLLFVGGKAPIRCARAD